MEEKKSNQHNSEKKNPKGGRQPVNGFILSIVGLNSGSLESNPASELGGIENRRIRPAYKSTGLTADDGTS